MMEIVVAFTDTRRAKLLIVGLFCILFLAACGAPRALQVRPFTTDLYIWPDMYRQNFSKINTFLGKARVTVESEEQSGHVSMRTAWLGPDRLHLQAEGPLGLDIGRVFIGEERFIIYNQFNNFFTSGSLDDPYLNRFLQTNVTLKELRFAVVGQATYFGQTPVLTDTLHGIFNAEDEGINYTYLVNPSNGLLERLEASRNGRTFYLQEFKNYEVINGVYLPMLTQITLPEERERISVYYQEVQLNIPLNPAQYAIEISPKVQQLNLN